MNKAFGGSLAIMDIYAAQLVFGRGRRFDRIDLRARDGVTVDEGRAAAALGPGFEVAPPSSRTEHFAALMQSYTMTQVSSLFALVVGMFIIYNSFSIAVTQRRSEIGILRALGATAEASQGSLSVGKHPGGTRRIVDWSNRSAWPGLEHLRQQWVI